MADYAEIRTGSFASWCHLPRLRSFPIVLLAALLASWTAQADDLRWVGCGITRKAFMLELAKAYEAKTGIKILAENGGATRGIRDTSSGASDMGGSCRSEIRKPGSLFPIIEESGVRLVPVAWDALVVIVHPGNPVDSLSLDQVRKLYRGEIRNWKDVGGRDQAVRLLVRKGKISGVGRTIRELIFADYDMDFTDLAEVLPSTGPLEKRVEEDPAAVGITGVSSARKRKVKILALEGVKSTYDNIKGALSIVPPPVLGDPAALA
jgi:phosphate transport system substrate-binding protein